MRENYNLRWVEDDPVPKVEPRKLTSAERVAAQRQANAQESERAWAHVQSEESQKRYAEQRKETLDKRKRFAKSSLIPDLSADVGKQKEDVSSIFGKWASFAIPIEYTPEIGSAGVWLSKVAGTVLSEFKGLAMRFVRTSPYAAVGVAIFYSPKIADGTLYGDTELYDLKSVKTNVRLGVSPSGLVPYGYHVDGTTINTVGVVKDGAKFVAHIEEGLTIEWVPVTEEEAGHNILVTPIPDAIEQHNIYVHPEADQGQEIDGISITPIAETDIKDCILTFPIGSGIPPFYIVYQSPRYLPGKATGTGKDIDGVWLAGANEGNGVPIPTRIAKKLKEHGEFKNFADFRSVLWTLVSEDNELVKQFKPGNVGNLKKGYAPTAIPSEWYEGPNEFIKRFEIHHIKDIQYDGGVYDIDNLGIVTPKNHKRIHYGEK